MPSLPKHRMPAVFRTDQAIKYTGMAPYTFRRYRDLLGIEPRRMYNVRGRFYFMHEVIRIMNMRTPKMSLFRHRVLDRYEAMKKAGLDKETEEW